MKRLGMIFLILLGFGLIATVYVTKTRTKSAKSEVERLQRDLANEQALIRTLEAEIAYLSRPERISILAQEHLGLRPTDAVQIITLDDMVTRIALKTSQDEGAKKTARVPQ